MGEKWILQAPCYFLCPLPDIYFFPPHSRSSLFSLLGESFSCLSFWFYDLCICPNLVELSQFPVCEFYMNEIILFVFFCDLYFSFNHYVWEISHVVPCGCGLFILMAIGYSILWIYRSMARPTPERNLFNVISTVRPALVPKPCSHQTFITG